MLYIIYCGRDTPATNKTISKIEIDNFFKSQSYLKYWTYIPCEGGWVDEVTGKTILEQSFKVEYYSELGNDDENVKNFAKDYKNQFGQQAVLVVKDYKTLSWI
jgi:hypothetical protein